SRTQGGGTTCRDRIGIGLGKHRPTDAGCDQGLAARARTASVVARFESDHRGRAGSGRAGSSERIDLGMWSAGATMDAFGDEVTGLVDDHATDTRIGVRTMFGGARQREGVLHRLFVSDLVDHLAPPVRSRTPGYQTEATKHTITEDDECHAQRWCEWTVCVRFPSGL